MKQLDSHPLVNVFANIFFATIIPAIIVGCIMVFGVCFQTLFDVEFPEILLKVGCIYLMIEIVIVLLLGITTLIFHRD